MVGTPVKLMTTMIGMTLKVAVLPMRGAALNHLIPHSYVLENGTCVDPGIIRTSTAAGLGAAQLRRQRAYTRVSKTQRSNLSNVSAFQILSYLGATRLPVSQPWWTGWKGACKHRETVLRDRGVRRYWWVRLSMSVPQLVQRDIGAIVHGWQVACYSSFDSQ